MTGRDGKRLDATWEEAQEAYLTVTIPDFPNWFMIGGPNSPVGNFSWPWTFDKFRADMTEPKLEDYEIA